MANPNTPGVEFNEVDKSFFIRGANADIGALIGATQKGRLSEPVLCGSWPDYVREFGEYVDGSLLPYVAKRALDQGAQVYIVREDHKIANVHQSVKAEIDLETNGGQASAAVRTSAAGPFSLAVGDLIGVKVNGDAAVNSDAIAATNAEMTTSAGPFALTDGSSIDFRVGPASEPVQRVTFHTADFAAIGSATKQEVIAVLNRDLDGTQAYLGGPGLKLRTDVQGSSARLQIVAASAAGILTALGLSVSTAVGSGNVADISHITASELVDLFSSPEGFVAGVVGPALVITGEETGASASIQIDPATTSGATAAKLGLPTAVLAGAASTAVPTIKVQAKDPGAYGNSLQVTTYAGTNDPAGSFRWSVLYRGTVVEGWDEMSMDPTNSRYFVKVIAKSKWITATDLAAAIAAPGNRPNFGANSVTVDLAGGEDAISTMVNLDIIGDSDARTGIHALDATRDASFVAAPGWTSQTVLNAGLAYCEDRKDMLWVGSVPFDISPNEAIQYRNATGSYSSGSKPNSSFAALYYDWFSIEDPVTMVDKWLPPDGDVFAAFARCKKPWFAPAGNTRGKLQGIKTLRYSPSDNEIGNMYAVGINTYFIDPDYGPQLNGQRTLQVVPSATDRVNVRRLFIYLRKSITPSVKNVVWEPNDETTWSELRRLVNPFMRQVKAGRGVYDFKFVVDETTTTDTDIDNNRLVANLYVKPTKTAEFIKFNLIALATGTSFLEAAA